MKIPAQAKKVFSGIMFDVYQWEQDVYDGTSKTFEMIKRPDTTQIIAVSDGKILISDEEQPTKGKFYTLFGGRVESGEEPLKSAKRELLEESGTASDDWELINKWEPITKIDWTIHLYIARNCKKVSEQKLDAGEKIIVKPVSFEEFVEIVTSEQFSGKELVMNILKMKLEPKKLEEFKKKIFKN
ncbi:MAG: NUDIX hydrolase [uncultured bacterium]|nr:MAG: NUDIX hydrolase [uncultured bacterium]HBD05393.1 hypothetical protein [Candidatus Uhrbacteria bacterium]